MVSDLIMDAKFLGCSKKLLVTLSCIIYAVAPTEKADEVLL